MWNLSVNPATPLELKSSMHRVTDSKIDKKESNRDKENRITERERVNAEFRGYWYFVCWAFQYLFQTKT